MIFGFHFLVVMHVTIPIMSDTDHKRCVNMLSHTDSIVQHYMHLVNKSLMYGTWDCKVELNGSGAMSMI